jgi:transposase
MHEVEAALGRVKTQLGQADFDLFKRLVSTVLAVTAIVNSQRSMLARLRRLFGLSSSEKTRDLLVGAGRDASATTGSDNEAGTTAGAAPIEPTTGLPEPGSTPAVPERPKRKGHGRLPTSVYEAATQVAVPHERLLIGGPCPDCRFGKLYELKEPARILRIVGQPLLAGTCWNCQRLRCSSCGSVHTARAPAEAQGPKFDQTAVAMLALCRYSLGLPHNRMEKLQRNMKLPVPASTQWDVIQDNAPAFEPIFAELERQAAQGEVVHNDDTKAGLLAFMGERRAKLLRDADFPDPERVGLFTTAIVSITNDKPIVLFYTGRKYAGENLAGLLEARDTDLEPPTLMSDGLDSRNMPAGHSVVASNCLVHARRGIVDQVINFPNECRHVLEQLRKVYIVEAKCKKARLSREERLALHQSESGPVMQELHKWMLAELEEKRVEPNSELGKAYRYMLKRWDKLTLFLHRPGVPLDNNICEQTLKMAIRHRRNSLFYRSERGAEIGDMFMALIHNAELRGENAFDYLTAALHNETAVAEAPADWMPWNYRETIARITQQSAPLHAPASA